MGVYEDVMGVGEKNKNPQKKKYYSKGNDLYNSIMNIEEVAPKQEQLGNLDNMHELYNRTKFKPLPAHVPEYTQPSDARLAAKRLTDAITGALPGGNYVNQGIETAGEKIALGLGDMGVPGFEGLTPELAAKRREQWKSAEEANLSPTTKTVVDVAGNVMGSIPLFTAVGPVGGALSGAAKARGAGKLLQGALKHGGTVGAFEGVGALTRPTDLSDYLDPEFYLNAGKKTLEGFGLGGVAGPAGDYLGAGIKKILPGAVGHYAGNLLGGATTGTGFAYGGDILEGQPPNNENAAINAILMGVMGVRGGGRYNKPLPPLTPEQKFNLEFQQKTQRPPMISRTGGKIYEPPPGQEMPWDTPRPPMISLQGQKPPIRPQISLRGNTAEGAPRLTGRTVELLSGQTGRPPLISLKGPSEWQRMIEDIRPTVEAEIAKVYVPGFKPSPQQFDKFVRDVAVSKGYDYDAIKAQSKVAPVKQPKMITVEGPAYSPQEKQVIGLDKEIKDADKYLAGIKKDAAEAAKAAQAEGNIFAYIKSRGGIKPSPSIASEYRQSVPLALRNKNGMVVDELAEELGMNSRQLLDELNRGKSKAFDPELAAARDPQVQAIQKTVDTMNAEKDELLKNLNKPRVTKPGQYGIVKEKPEGDYYVKEGNGNVPLAKRPGMDSAGELEGLAQVTGGSGGYKDLTFGEIRKLAQSGKLSLEQFKRDIEPRFPFDKNTIMADIVKAKKGGAGVPDAGLTLEQWYHRKRGTDYPKVFHKTSYEKKIKAEYNKFIKEAKTIDFLDEAEKAARERINSRKGRLLSGTPVDDIADYAVIGAAKLARGTVKFSQWAAEMVKEYGSKVAPRLKDIYAKSKELHSRYVNGDKEAIRIINGVDKKPEGTKVGVSPEPVKNKPPTNTVPTAKNTPDTGDADTFRAKINREASKKSTPFREKFDQLRTQLVDAFVPLENVEKGIRGKISSAENSLYKTARLFKGGPEKAHEIIRAELNPVIEGIEKKGYSYQDLGDYALAVHAKDVNALGKKMIVDAEKSLSEGVQFNETVKDMIKKGETVSGKYKLADISQLKADLEDSKRFKSGFTDAENNAVISKYGTSEMETARKELVSLSGRLLDDLADAGRISVEDVKVMKEKWPNYMPLFRSFDDAKIEFSKGLSDSFANVANPIKKLKGSDREVIDPIENMIKNIFKITNTADRTRVGNQLLKLADEDVSGEFVRRLKEGEEVGRKNVLNLYEKGNKVQVEVQSDVYKAMLDMDKETSLLLVELLSKPASLLRAGATLTPEFSVRNPVRDVLNAFVVSESGFNPITDFPVALTQAIFKGRKVKILGKEIQTPGDLYTQFLKDNGGYGNIVSMDRKVHREALESALKKSTGKKFVNIVNPKTWLDVLRAISDTTETATKLGEYRAATRKGETRQEAAYRARDLMDFARSGTSIKQANRIVAFLNANIQGKSKLIRAIKENPAKVTAKAILAITLPTIGAYVAQKTLSNDIQRQNIEDAPNWLRDTFWLIPIPGTNQVARVPKPFDLAPIFSNSVERLLDYVVEKDPEAFGGFVKRTLSDYSIPIMVTGLTPLIEGMANYSFFRQGPVIPQREQGLRYKDQQDINTTETAKILAAGIEKITGGQGTFKNFSSPRVIDNTIIGATAGLGRYATSAIDTILESSGIIDKPERPSKLISQRPVLRAFLVNENSTGESVDKLYEERDRLTRAKSSAKLNKEPFRENRMLRRVEIATKRISSISKRIRQVENSPSLTGNAKRDLIKKLSADRNRISREAIEAMKK